MKYPTFKEASSEDPFRSKAGAHVGSYCPAVITADFQADALDVESLKCVSHHGLDGVAAEGAP